MRCSIVLVVVLADFFKSANSKSVGNYYESAPWVLLGDQPEDNSFQVRLYNATKWATVSIDHFTEYEAAEEGFVQIYEYITGGNDKEVKMAMTVPLTVQTYHSECVFCERTFNISYYIPPMYQSSPPLPTNPNIIIEKKPECIVYSRRVSGYPKPIRFLYEANNLYHHLLNNSVISVNHETMLFAIYDPPFKTFNKENQVWLFHKEDSYEYELEYPEEEEEEEEDEKYK